MATTVTSTERVIDQRIRGGSRSPGGNGKGGNGNGGNGHHKDHAKLPRFSSDAYRLTTWIVLAAIVMMFAALSSAYLVLSGTDQGPAIHMPKMFFLSTGLILASSATIEKARKSLAEANDRAYSWALLGTLFLGAAFLGSQLLGWQKLIAQGVYLSGRPLSSFYYLFTGAHGLHVLGGIMALAYLVFRNYMGWREPVAKRKKASSDAVSLYWHFMGGLWVWLFLLLLIWR